MTGGRIVYDSDIGRTDRCPRCGRHLDVCSCAAQQQVAGGDGIVRVSRERKGRGGKTVTLVVGLPLNAEGLSQVCTALKRTCGAGGTVEGGAVVIQGDHRERAATKLKDLGYRVKLAGG
ncbi:MAG: stress response translation initiation inhibitor YciH [Chloroflexota bacterium]